MSTGAISVEGNDLLNTVPTRGASSPYRFARLELRLRKCVTRPPSSVSVRIELHASHLIAFTPSTQLHTCTGTGSVRRMAVVNLVRDTSSLSGPGRRMATLPCWVPSFLFAGGAVWELSCRGCCPALLESGVTYLSVTAKSAH